MGARRITLDDMVDEATHWSLSRDVVPPSAAVQTAERLLAASSQSIG